MNENKNIILIKIRTYKLIELFPKNLASGWGVLIAAGHFIVSSILSQLWFII